MKSTTLPPLVKEAVTKLTEVEHSYGRNQFEIQVREDEEGARIIRLRNFTQNKIVEITKNDSMIEHIIRDPDRTVKFKYR